MLLEGTEDVSTEGTGHHHQSLSRSVRPANLQIRTERKSRNVLLMGHCQWRILDFPDREGANPKGGGANLIF